jgi:hypothetical protein
MRQAFAGDPRQVARRSSSREKGPSTAATVVSKRLATRYTGGPLIAVPIVSGGALSDTAIMYADYLMWSASRPP